MMDGKVQIEIHHTALHDLNEIHDKWMELNPSMARQDINYVLLYLIRNEKSRLGLYDGKPFPPVKKGGIK